KDVWVDADGVAARRFSAERFGAHYSEYARAWWVRNDPQKAAAQIERSISHVAAGTPDEVFTELAAYLDAGVDLFVLEVHIEETSDRWRAQLELLAESVVPRLREHAGRRA